MAKNIISDAAGNALHSGGPTKNYEDTNFVVGSSPATHNVRADLGRNSHDGYLACDGPGDLTVAFSSNGTVFGDDHPIKSGETISLLGLDINAIRITWVADSAYRIFAV